MLAPDDDECDDALLDDIWGYNRAVKGKGMKKSGSGTFDSDEGEDNKPASSSASTGQKVANPAKRLAQSTPISAKRLPQTSLQPQKQGSPPCKKQKVLLTASWVSATKKIVQVDFAELDLAFSPGPPADVEAIAPWGQRLSKKCQTLMKALDGKLDPTKATEEERQNGLWKEATEARAKVAAIRKVLDGLCPESCGECSA